MKVARYSLNILATLAIGYALSRWIDQLPYEFSPLPATITAIMRAVGVDTVAHGDDVEAIGLVVIIVASLSVAVVIVWLANRLIMSRRHT
jgi:hypothetical protein